MDKPEPWWPLDLTQDGGDQGTPYCAYKDDRIHFLVQLIELEAGDLYHLTIYDPDGDFVEVDLHLDAIDLRCRLLELAYPHPTHGVETHGPKEDLQD